MILNQNRLRNTKNWLLFIAIGLGVSFIQKPANSFVPYVFQPNLKSLNNASINLGKTAAQLFHFGQNKEASRVAKLAVQLNPNDERLWSILANIQVRNNLLKEASQSLSKAKKLNPKNAKLWFAEGQLSLQQKKTKHAITLIKKGLSIEPNNANAYFQLGNAQIMQSKLQSALESFQKASQIQPNFWEAINNQGLVLFEMGKTNDAIYIWRNVLTINENSEPMLALAAALNQIKKNNKESLKLAQKALVQNPNYVSSKHQSEQLWGKKLQHATRLLLKNPNLKDDVKRALANSN